MSPIIYFILIIRLFLGKEDKKRYKEKLGIYKDKKNNESRLVWFHACSVGEVRSISKLINGFLSRRYSILITSNTLLSAKYVKENFPDKVKHLFLPIDFKFATKKFLSHWKPSIGIFIESEIWPNLIRGCNKNKIPLVLAQARFSKNTLKKWYLFKKFFRALLESFDLIIAQSSATKKELYKYANIKVNTIYNLKNSSPQLNIKRNEVNKINKNIHDKFIITALSTHEGEERILLKALKEISKKIKHTVLILQPRHPHRANKIIKQIQKYNFTWKQKSLFEYPNKNTRVYLGDTFGESGTLIYLSDIVILGGTLSPIGGHNIIEPAQMAKCILVGNYYSKIQDTIKVFKKNKAIKLLSSNKYISKTIIDLYKDKDKIINIGKNAYTITKGYPQKEKSIINKIISIKKINENSKILVPR